MRYQSIIKEQLRRTVAAELSAKEPIKTMFTAKELAALHLGAQFILEVIPQVDDDGAMRRAMEAAERSMTAEGFKLTSQGWEVK